MPPPAPELVNPIALDDLPAWLRSLAVTFLGDARDADTERRLAVVSRTWQPTRAWGVRDRGAWVGTLLSQRRTLAVPGVGAGTRDLPVDAVTAVTVAATHRRGGLLRRMLEASLGAARERGDAVSILVAAEWPIYGRFGYAPATLAADYVLHRSRRGSEIAGEPARVRPLEPDEFGAVAPAVFAAARRERAGQIDRDQVWWDAIVGRDGYPRSPRMPPNLLVHEGDDGPDGLLGWKASGDVGLLPPMGTIEVWDLIGAGAAAYRDLWSYLSGIDLIDRITLSNRPIDEPARWLLPDARALVMTEQVDFMWLRLLDVPAALAARRYALAGEVVLDVADRAPGAYAAGRYQLQADGDDVRCEPTDRAADVGIDQRALASAYLGGFGVWELHEAGLVREHTPGALDRLATMFSTPRPPWNATRF